MEKYSHTPKNIGGTEKDKAEAVSHVDKAYDSVMFSYAEIPPTSEQLHFINSIARALPLFLNKYDVVAKENDLNERIHIIGIDKLSPQHKEIFGGHVAVYNKEDGRMYVSSEIGNDSLKFIFSIAHEFFHSVSFKSNTIIAENPESLTLHERRSGLGVIKEKDDKELETYFQNLDEAVVDRLAELFVQNLDEGQNSGIQITNGDGFVSPTYPRQKRELDKYIRNIYEKNTGTFKSADDVFTLFVDAVLKGKLMPLARIIEKTYGKG